MPPRNFVLWGPTSATLGAPRTRSESPEFSGGAPGPNVPPAPAVLLGAMGVCSECGVKGVTGTPCPEHQTPLVDEGSDPLLGSQVGSFRIARQLGEGGMGLVYLGVHPSIGSRVAIKVLSHECTRQEDLVLRFFDEAKVVNVIRHENIVNVIDLARLEDGRPYIVMEHLDGAPLSSVFQRSGPMPLPTLGRLMLDVLRAIGAAHQAGIIHRDLKPDNIFVTPEGRAKVLDFGIAKLRDDLHQRTSATRTGSVLGTPQYMAPEQAMGRKIDARADVYALGVILYEGVTGRQPIPGDSIYALIRNQVEFIPIAPQSLRPDLTPSYAAVIMRALEKDPAARFGSAVEFAAALEHAMTGAPPWPAQSSGWGTATPVPLGPPSLPGRPLSQSRPRKPVPVAFLASVAAIAVAGALGGVAWWRGDFAAAPATVAEVTETPDEPLEPELPGDPSELSDQAHPSEPHSSGPPDEPQVPEPPGEAHPSDTPEPPSTLGQTDGENRAGPRDAANSQETRAPTHGPRTPHQAKPSKATQESRTRRGSKSSEEAGGEIDTRPSVPEEDSGSASKYASFDVSGFFPKAQQIARKQFRDAELLKIIAYGVRPDGRAELTLDGNFNVTYKFRSLAASKQQSTAPIGMPSTVKCTTTVKVSTQGVHTSTAGSSGELDCGPVVPQPRCSAKAIWKKAVSAGAPSGNAVAQLIYMANGGSPQWRVTVGPFRRWLPDDC